MLVVVARCAPVPPLRHGLANGAVHDRPPAIEIVIEPAPSPLDEGERGATRARPSSFTPRESAAASAPRPSVAEGGRRAPVPAAVERETGAPVPNVSDHGDEYDALEPATALRWTTLLGPGALVAKAAPTAPPAASRARSEAITAAVEADVLAADGAVGLRAPETAPIVAALVTSLRTASLPNGTRISFVVELDAQGAMRSIAVRAQSGGDGRVGARVAADLSDRFGAAKLGLGGYARGARVTITASVADEYPSNADRRLALRTDCPTGEHEGVAPELRDIRAFIPWPQDPNQAQPLFAPIGGDLYRGSDRGLPRSCPRFVFDVGDWASEKTRHVHATVRVTPR